MQASQLPELPLIQVVGVNANVSFAGVVAPGLYQINVTIPGTVPDGDNAVTASYRGVQASTGALITVKR